MVKDGKLKKKDIKNDSVIFVGEDSLHYEKFADGSVKCIEDEIPFELPEGWSWARLGTVCSKVTDGTHHSPNNYPIGEYKYVTAKNIKLNGIILEDITYVTAEVHKEIFSRCNPEFGDILYIKDGATSGIATINTLHEEFSMLSSVALLKPAYGIDNWYMCYAMQSPYFYTITRGNMKGVGITRITLNMLVSRLIPVPPLQEQKQISVKCRELISLSSNIENDKEFIRQILSETKSKILDLAIRGKLVPQDPNDEPASVLLERIRAEKEELIKQGKIKRDKKESVIFKGEDNSYYGIHLPDSWDWASLREIALSISDGSHNPPPDNGSGIPLLSAANINDNSILMNEISRWITNEEWKIENQRTNIEVGDVLLTIVGSIGRSAVVQNSNHFALQRSVAVIKPCLINPLYLMHIVQSPQIQKWLTDNSKGTAQKGIYLNALSLMIIPIPPLAEQARIVEQIHIAYKQLDLISNALL